MQHKTLWALCLALLVGKAAHAVGRIADVTVIDRDSGAVLTPYYRHGEYWVAGRPGARYAIRIRNHRPERLLAVTSVDGLNVLTGVLASWDQAGYVFRPDEDYEISGWRKSDAEVADFTFTDPSSSYAGRTDRPANIGIIGIALFRERSSEPPLIGGDSPRAREPSAQLRTPPSPTAGKAAGAADDSTAPSENRSLQAQRSSPAMPSAVMPAPLPAPGLGTGHGEREYSYVSHTEFARLSTTPDEVIRIRYDRLENLIAMGIVRRPPPVQPQLNPFPASAPSAYVPDPPG